MAHGTNTGSSQARLLLSASIAAGMVLISAKTLWALDSYALQPADDSSQPPTPLSFELKGSENFTYDSNPNQLSKGEKSLWGSVTAPELIITDVTPDSHLNLDTLLDENLYNLSNFDSTDLHETFKLGEQVSDWSADLQARADYDTTRSSELTTFGLNLDNVRHTGASVTPTIAYNLTSVDKFSLSASSLIARYDNSAFINYDIFSVTPAYAHNFDPNNAGTISFGAQRYETESGPSQTTDSFGPSLGWTSTLSQTFKLNLQAGAQESQQSGSINTTENSQWNYVFSGDLAYTGLQDTAHLTASRAQYPYANGVETLLTSFGGTEIHNLNPYFAVNLSANYQFAQDPITTSINFDHELNGGIGLTYHLFEHLDITSNYQYTDETLTNIGGTIKESVVMLGLTYHPAMKAL